MARSLHPSRAAGDRITGIDVRNKALSPYTPLACLLCFRTVNENWDEIPEHIGCQGHAAVSHGATIDSLQCRPDWRIPFR
jgi:hypothetical protein